MPLPAFPFRLVRPAADRAGAGAPARWLLAWLFSLSFWLVQAGAAAHALEHLHDADHADLSPCELCVAYAGVTAGGLPAAGPPDFALADEGFTPAAAGACAPAPRPWRVRIRAPPPSSSATLC